MENINWYPGHMKKTRELIRDNLKLVDSVIEVIDARIPRASRNPIVEELISEKPRVIVLNKMDLADEDETVKWIRKLSCRETRAVAVNCVKGDGVKKIFGVLEEYKNERTGRDRPFRVMIVGVPNVGKSSLINRMTGKKSTRTGDRPGVTKGKQWLTLPAGMQLLDTPGILWPKFEDPLVGRNLAYCGSIKDEVMDPSELALSLIEVLSTDYPDLLCNRYKLEEISATPLETMEGIAEKRGFILSGKRIDYERCGRTVLDEFRSGKIGRITLEKCEA